MMNKDHWKKILESEKAFLPMKDVKFVNVPCYDEIAVKHLYDKAISMPGMSKFFPDTYPKGRSCCRQYFYNIWATVHPETVKKVVDFANKQRYSITADKVKANTITISDEMQQLIDSMDFISKQKGRFTDLLKKKSQICTLHKPRITYDAFNFSKRPRDSSLKDESSVNEKN